MNNDDFIGDVTKEFRDKVCEAITVKQQGVGRLVIESPFTFEDGDSYVIVLLKRRDSWIFTDEAHTLMHLSYWIEDIDDLTSGNRHDILERTLASHFMNLSERGEIEMMIKNNDFGNSLFTYIQGITNIMDLTYLTREVVKSTFLDDFDRFMKENVSPESLMISWNQPEIDKEGKYLIPYYVKSPGTPLFVFPIDNENRMKDANITLFFFKIKHFRNRSVIVFENIEDLNKRPLARLMDAGDKLFSNFEGNKEDIKEYISPNSRWNG